MNRLMRVISLAGTLLLTGCVVSEKQESSLGDAIHVKSINSSSDMSKECISLEKFTELYNSNDSSKVKLEVSEVYSADGNSCFDYTSTYADMFIVSETFVFDSTDTATGACLTVNFLNDYAFDGDSLTVNGIELTKVSNNAYHSSTQLINDFGYSADSTMFTNGIVKCREFFVQLADFVMEPVGDIEVSVPVA